MAEEHQLDRMERMLRELYTQSGGGEIDTNVMSKSAVRALVVELCESLASGELIPAMRMYRTLTGASLKEAKDAIVSATQPLTRKW
jgi:ribosomal protein L7/L12